MEIISLYNKICEHCGCHFRYDYNDIIEELVVDPMYWYSHRWVRIMPHIKCPICGNKTIIHHEAANRLKINYQNNE